MKSNTFRYRCGNIPIKRGEIHINCYYAIVSGTFPKKKLNEMLHPEERKKYDALLHQKRQESFLIGRLAAKYAYKEAEPFVSSYDILIDSGVFNYPFIYHKFSHNYSISLSHSNDVAVALVFPRNHIIGIDLEQINLEYLEVMKKIISDKEEGLIQMVNDSKMIYPAILWTAKEALSKAIRTGFAVDTNILEIDKVIKVRQILISTFKFFHQYKSLSMTIGNFVCSITLPKNSEVNLDSFYSSLNEIQILNRENTLL